MVETIWVIFIFYHCMFYIVSHHICVWIVLFCLLRFCGFDYFIAHTQLIIVSCLSQACVCHFDIRLSFIFYLHCFFCFFLIEMWLFIVLPFLLLFCSVHFSIFIWPLFHIGHISWCEVECILLVVMPSTFFRSNIILFQRKLDNFVWI